MLHVFQITILTTYAIEWIYHKLKVVSFLLDFSLILNSQHYKQCFAPYVAFSLFWKYL